jgi:hypothetical protein
MNGHAFAWIPYNGRIIRHLIQPTDRHYEGISKLEKYRRKKKETQKYNTIASIQMLKGLAKT